MKGDYPFNPQIVHFELSNPNPVVEYLDHDENTSFEVVRTVDNVVYNEKFPRSYEEYALQDLIDAGVPLKEVNTRLYETNDALSAGITQSDLLSELESAINKNNVEE